MRDQLATRMPMGAVTKVHAVYDRPFWRDEGLNGQLVTDEGALRSTFDNSPPDASYGALVGFVAGNECRHFERAGPAARRARRAGGVGPGLRPRPPSRSS